MRSVCQSVLAKRLQQIHYHPTARLTSQPGQARGGSCPRQTANNAALVRACNKRTEGTCLNFRARPLLTQKDGLYPPKPTTPPPHHHHHHPLPPHPNPPSTGGEKNLHTLRSSTVHALFFLFGACRRYGKVVSLPLPIPPSFSFSSSVMCVGCSCFAQSSCSTPNTG